MYVYEDKITLAVNAALATGRPLLIEGPPGSDLGDIIGGLRASAWAQLAPGASPAG